MSTPENLMNLGTLLLLRRAGPWTLSLETLNNVPRESGGLGVLRPRREVPEERSGRPSPAVVAARQFRPPKEPALLPRGWARAHRFLQVAARLFAVLGMVVEHGAELQVRAGLDALRRLEGEHSLQAVHTQADLGRAGRAEVLGEAQKCQVP